MISSCVGEISPNLCHSCQHSSQPPDAQSQRLNELCPGNRELQDDIGFKFEENLHIPQLQPPTWKADTKYDLLTLYANLPEADVYFSECLEAEWTKLITLQLQSHVQLEKNNIQLLLARNQVMKAQYDREYQELIVELEAVKSDIMQYEDYISSKCYSFNNETWEYLKNVGRNELRSRKQMYLQQKMHLKQRSISCWEEMKIYYQIMTYLKEEEIRRQQRMAECSTNMLHHRKLGRHLLQNVLNRVTEEQKEIATRKCLVLNEMKANGLSQQNNTHCILKVQKLGCTFDFMLKHRVYSCGNVCAYNDMVDIFEKRVPSPETPQSIHCMQTLLITALENYNARLDQEIALYWKKLKHTASTEKEGQKRLEKDEICSPVLPEFSDSKGASETAPFDLSILPGSADHNHEEISFEFTMNKVPEVKAVNNEEMKIYSQPVLQVSSVFREQPDDSDIQNTPSMALEGTSESTQTEKRKQVKPLKDKAEKLGFKQQEYDAHKLWKMKPTAERRAKMAGMKKDTSLAELLEKKLTLHITTTGSELCEIRKENETLRNKLDKILSTLQMKNDNNEQLDNKGKKLLDESEQFTTQNDKIGLQLPSVENMDCGGKGAWITQEESRAMSSRNGEKAKLQHLSQDHMVTGTKQENIPAQKDKPEWQLHSDGVPRASTSRTEIKEDFMAHENLGLQSHTAQVLVLGGKDADANKKGTQEKITVHGVEVGLQISSDEDFCLGDETEDHAARRRNKMLIQKLSLLLDCIKEDDRPVSEHFVRHIKRIINVNKLVSPPLMKKLIDTITARSQRLVTLHHGNTTLAVKAEEFGQDSGAEKLEDLEISSDTMDSGDYSSSSTDSECSLSESSYSDFC
ncbi:hypothetical protein B7P43_G10452 [Cryptotermes secundus]|uniref:Uncharacterized protein n=1 Tax=Cryptotermes secundus TaxID=105785 RepID=A0A2J7RLE1_9NEOP|nr:uncharacterized protein LOC111871938 [Cryptotermes secundus]XP_023721142.1 uncharacterized protein LOC111871938 [Cryptotermes secundus]XP_023721145.1 uncharacterized protein LOC111871938 [Cryptotermes secundus]PNF41619.1 hypothetical protein B7P43_G10452 [Cryptotermes secundus]